MGGYIFLGLIVILVIWIANNASERREQEKTWENNRRLSEKRKLQAEELNYMRLKDTPRGKELEAMVRIVQNSTMPESRKFPDLISNYKDVFIKNATPENIKKLENAVKAAEQWKESIDKIDAERKAKKENEFKDLLNSSYEMTSSNSQKRGIYFILNIKNNDMYIGSSSNMYSRRSNHLFLMKNKRHHSYKVNDAVERYGFNVFRFYVAQELDHDTSLTYVEQKYIDKYSPSLNVETDATGRSYLHRNR